MIDLLRIHVIWDAQSADGARTAECISRHFDGIGMDRDGVAYRVPVRFSSSPWSDGSALPRPIDLSRAKHNALIILYDEEMHEHRAEWSEWTDHLRKQIAHRQDADVYIAFGSFTGDPALASDASARIQYAPRKNWFKSLDEASRNQRLLLLVLIRIRAHLRKLKGEVRKEPIFVSHAKADGDPTARAIVDFINDTQDGVPLETFYDAKELMPGENYEQRFKEEIGHGTLLAVVSDVYDSRPWCVFELTEAKRHRRPIVLADVGRGRTSRTYPYGANLPRVKVDVKLGSTQWIEPLLVEAMSEGLRCDLFIEQANEASPHNTLVLPRPPELFDIVDRDNLPGNLVYPDPPLGTVEAELVRRVLAAMSPATRMITLGEIT